MKRQLTLALLGLTSCWSLDAAAQSKTVPAQAEPTPVPLVVLGTVAGATLGQIGGIYAGFRLGPALACSSGCDVGDGLGAVALGGITGMALTQAFLTPAFPYWLDRGRGSYWSGVGGAIVGGVLPLAVGVALSRGSDSAAGPILFVSAFPGHVIGALIGYYASVDDGEQASSDDAVAWSLSPRWGGGVVGLEASGRF